MEVHDKSPVCPFCEAKIHSATLVVSGMKNFYLCPNCDKVLSVEMTNQE